MGNTHTYNKRNETEIGYHPTDKCVLHRAGVDQTTLYVGVLPQGEGDFFADVFILERSRRRVFVPHGIEGTRHDVESKLPVAKDLAWMSALSEKKNTGSNTEGQTFSVVQIYCALLFYCFGPDYCVPPQ